MKRDSHPNQPSPPAGVVWPEGLTRHERDVIEPLLGQAIHFMDDPVFQTPSELKAFWNKARQIARPHTDWYSALSRSDDRPRAKQIEALPLLSAHQERALFLCLNDARRRAEQVRRSIDSRRMTVTDARRLLHWLDQARRLREVIAEYNLGLVLAMLRRYRHSDAEFAELISEGNLALLNAIDKFRVSRGFKFSSYACRCIRAAMGNCIIRNTKQHQRFPVSFDPAFQRSDHDEQKARAHEQDCVDELGRIIEANAADLSEIEQEVIRLRFFRKNERNRPLTLEQVGKQVGYTKERVRQIQLAALAKLRHTLEAGFLDGPRVESALN